MLKSRQRKTKCSGERPRCSPCALRRIPCTWPASQENQIPQPHGGEGDGNSSSKRQRLLEGQSSRALPSISLTSRTLRLLRERHLSVEFCSFLHMPVMDANILHQKSPFLVHASIALAALYMSEDEILKEGHTQPDQLSEWHATIARDHSRQSVDSPSSKLYG